jgi:type II secretory ATPase GspE/PulE/Tfp pilus assembly ATPase PilB-like protein
MKLSKSLLGAILVGVTVQTAVTSCTKKSNETFKPTSEAQANPESQANPNSQNPTQNPSECPACGMG